MKNTHPIRKVLAAVLALALSLGLACPAWAATSAELKEELSGLKDQNRQIQAQIDALQNQYDEAADELQALVDKKDAIDQEISLLHERILNMNEQVRLYGQLIADTQDELDEAQVLWDELNEKNIERIRAMEEQGTLTYWQVLFESHSFTDLLDRLNMVDEIAAADQRRLDEMKQAADVVRDNRARLQDDMAALQESRDILRQSEADLEIKRTESDDIIRQLAKRREEFQELLDQSEALQDYLMQEIAQKEKEVKKAVYKEELVKMALKGENPPSDAKWIEPVSDYTITSPFGMRTHPVYKYQLMHNGVDLACPKGTPIYATRGGTVTKAAFQAGGAGYYVSISHGDGFASIYMHMTHYVVSAGQTVSQGQLIGYVGSTGVSTGPHLHFGVSYGGTYVNPMAYI